MLTATISHFSCRLVEVSFLNRDGSSRQKAIASCRLGEEVQLRPETVDSCRMNAVAVHRLTGSQIGYLPAFVAEDVRDVSARAWA